MKIQVDKFNLVGSDLWDSTTQLNWLVLINTEELEIKKFNPVFSFSFFHFYSLEINFLLRSSDFIRSSTSVSDDLLLRSDSLYFLFIFKLFFLSNFVYFLIQFLVKRLCKFFRFCNTITIVFQFIQLGLLISIKLKYSRDNSRVYHISNKMGSKPTVVWNPKINK